MYSFERTDVIVDVTGYMTGATAPAGSDGLFVPITPARLLDTRTPGPASSGQPIASSATLPLPIAGHGGVPGSGVQAVALNVTATRTQAPGYVTTWPANTPITDTSSLNYVAAGRSVPNHVVAPINGGAVSFYSFGGTDLLVDVMGYWLDATAVAPGTGGAVVSVNTITPPSTTIAPAVTGDRRRLRIPLPERTEVDRRPVRTMEPVCADPVHGQRRRATPADGRRR